METNYSKEEKAEIWLDSFGLDYAKKSAVMELAASAYAAAENFAALRGRVSAIAGEETAARMDKTLQSGEYLRELLHTYAEKEIRCVTYSGELYPELLRQIPDPPLVLYCRGNAELLRCRKFAIVGSRRTLPQVLRRTEEFSRALTAYFAVVTGIADGGDSAALVGALERGKVISVLPYGMDHVYPACNRGLLAEAERRGLVISEYLPHEKPAAYRFPARNRIMAGLSEGVLVVSGGERSGTRITAERAYEYGRDVFAFPYSIGIESGAGCNKLIKEYAKLTENLVDICSAFGINLTETEEVALSGAELAVYRMLLDGEKHAAEIAEGTGLKAYELPAVLTLLEMKKLIVPCGGNRWAAR